ncbi:hypothetical protein V3C99_007192, partial [Haemonchus contortus]
ADKCKSKTCQCPAGKVESETGKCIDVSYCPTQSREKRQARPLAQIPGIISQVNCLLRGNCPTPRPTPRPPPPPPPPPRPCGRNERRYACGTACEPTCATPYPTCTSRCVPNVCQCEVGYIRYTGSCIPKYACPTTRPVVVVPPPPPPVYPGRYLTYYIPPYSPYYGQQFRYYTCSPYEYYVQCIPCEPVCNSNYYLCYQYCVDGCTCRPGLVRDMFTNNCVYSYYCPRVYRSG